MYCTIFGLIHMSKDTRTLVCSSILDMSEQIWQLYFKVRWGNMSIVGNMSTDCDILNNNGNWIKFGF